jgi:hypothetical protein
MCPPTLAANILINDRDNGEYNLSRGCRLQVPVHFLVGFPGLRWALEHLEVRVGLIGAL